MFVGELLQVYIDPYAERKLEGWAYIIEIVKKDSLYYYCNVRFEKEDRIVFRKIRKH